MIVIKRNWLLLFAGIMVCGCAGLSLTQQPVAFDNPYAVLALEEVSPLPEEESGVFLRFAVPSKETTHTYTEKTVLYGKIEAGEGIRLVVESEQKEEMKKGATAHTIDLVTTTKIKGEREETVAHIEMSDQGALTQFIEGAHASSFGTLTVRDWQRTKIFPDAKVAIGDTWVYTESIDVELSSWLVKDQQPEPYTIQARSTLEGFSVCMGRRCAVIKTIVVKKKTHHLKVLFAKLNFTMHTALEERTFFDYQKGIVIGQIIKIDSRTTSDNPHLFDISKGQTVRSLFSEHTNTKDEPL